MARARDFDPGVEIPWTMRLAEFLLGSGDVLGAYGQRSRQRELDESKLHDIDIDNLLKFQQITGAQEDRAAALAEKKRQFDEAQGLKRTAAEQAGRKRSAISRLILGDQPSALAPEEAEALGDVKGDSVLSRLLFPPEKKPFMHNVPAGTTVLGEGGTPVYAAPEKPQKAASLGTSITARLAARGLDPETADPQAIRDAIRELEASELEKAKQTGAIAAGYQAQGEQRRNLIERGQKADQETGELGQAQAMIERMGQAVPKVNTPGLLGRAAGLTTRKLGEFAQTNPDINELAALGQGYISVIAKIVQRQSGILSNQDLTRAEKSVPQVSDNLEVAQRKLAVLRDILNTARGNLERFRRGEAVGMPEAPAMPPPRGVGLPGGGPPGWAPRSH